MQRFQLSVNVSDTLTLDAGWWEETMEETALGKPLPCRLIHPPEPTMYDQVLRHLETISHEARIPPKSQLNFGEIALATIAVCLRWGTYFAVLADRTKPIWPQTGQEEISMIGDEEMARINIEALRCSKNSMGMGGSNRNGRISCPTLLAGLPTD